MKKNLLRFLKKFIFIFFELLIFSKVFFFRIFNLNILKRYDFICVPNEISYGAPINILDYVRLKSKVSKKTFVIILSSSNNFLTFAKMIFNKDNYLIFNSKLIDLFVKLFCFVTIN